MQMSASVTPRLSVIILVRSDSEFVRHSFRMLCQQTVAPDIEAVVVTPSGMESSWIGAELEGLWGHKIVRLSVFGNSGRAKAAGVQAASAPLVAFAEDHSYMDAACGEAFIHAHRDPGLAVVGPVMRNANPHSSASWGCFLAFYGLWMTSWSEGELNHLPANQSCYKRDVLLNYGEHLAQMLQTESVLQWNLVSRGFRARQEPSAIVYHLNFSRLGDTIQEYFFAARLFAADRCRAWRLPRRAAYAFGMVLLPLVRLLRILRFASRAHLAVGVAARSLMPLVVVLGAGAVGEMLGYALGPGDAAERLARFEVRRTGRYSSRDLEAVTTLSADTK
jgi:hypothetical protein